MGHTWEKYPTENEMLSFSIRSGRGIKGDSVDNTSEKEEGKKNTSLHMRLIWR